MRTRRFSSPLSGLLLLIPMVCLQACGRQSASSSDVLTENFTPNPVRVGTEKIQMTLKDSSSRPVSGARISLEADMAHPGMAPVFADATETSPGHYEGDVNITMPGDWVVLVHGKLADGRKIERQIEMNGVEAK